jgi:hypothetical protein
MAIYGNEVLINTECPRLTIDIHNNEIDLIFGSDTVIKGPITDTQASEITMATKKARNPHLSKSADWVQNSRFADA